MSMPRPIVIPLLFTCTVAACSPADPIDATHMTSETVASTGEGSTAGTAGSTAAFTSTTEDTPTGGTSVISTTDTGEPVTGGTSSGTTDDTDDTDDTGEPDACQLSDYNDAPYYQGNASFNWMNPVDEPCTVATSTLTADGLELRFDCPTHAAQNAGEQVMVTLLSGPMPGLAPQVGDSLHVFYQLGGDNYPRPGLLFLRSGEQLIYFVVNGFFVAQKDINNANKHTAPLSINPTFNRCPLMPNPDWTGDANGYTCELESLAMIEFIGDGPALVLAEGMSGEIQYAQLTYTMDVRLARRGGENCGKGGDLERQTVAGALQAP